jgi:hypothetical protein
MAKTGIKLIAAATLAACFAAPASAAIVDFAHTWISSNPQANGISKLVITETATHTLKVQAFGVCSPVTNCNMGVVDAVAYAPTSQSTNLVQQANVAIVIYGLRKNTQTLQLVMAPTASGGLSVQSFLWYHDGSTTNYWVTVPFNRQ